MDVLIQTVEGRSRNDMYPDVYKQCKSLAEGETDLIANMANFAALLHQTFRWHWVGFYLIRPSGNAEELVLGPFQGPVACTRIAKGRGVCGTAWQKGSTILVENVNEFPGHIACSPLSMSEIVVPVFGANGNIIAVLDIDSDQLNDFTADDQINLELIVELLAKSSV